MKPRIQCVRTGTSTPYRLVRAVPERREFTPASTTTVHDSQLRAQQGMAARSSSEHGGRDGMVGG